MEYNKWNKMKIINIKTPAPENAFFMEFLLTLFVKYEGI
jgi:hypothetical protein